MAAVNCELFELDVRVYSFFFGFTSSFSSSCTKTPSTLNFEAGFDDFLPSSKVNLEDCCGESTSVDSLTNGGPYGTREISLVVSSLGLLLISGLIGGALTAGAGCT